MAVVLATAWKRPPVRLGQFPYYYVGQFLEPSEYDTGAKVQALADGQMSSNINGDLLTLNAGQDEYMYLFSPVAAGAITFTDLGVGVSGGWDGASWAEHDVGPAYGPITLNLDIEGEQPWYVYRTDFTGVGEVTWRLMFARAQ